MSKRLFYLIICVLALGFVAGVATAAPVVYVLTEGSDPPQLGGTVTLDLDGAVPDDSTDGVDTYTYYTEYFGGTKNPAIVDFSLWQLASPGALFEPSDIIQTWNGIYVQFASSTHATLPAGTPLALFVDIDNQPQPSGGMFGTLDFTIVGNQYFDTQGDVTGITFAPAEHDFQEDPADESTISTSRTDPLSWVLPEPNDTINGTVTCDVWFAIDDDYPEAGLYPGDPNFTDYATKIVSQQAVLSEPIPGTLVKDHDYYWRIDTYDDSTHEPQPVIGKVFIFDTRNLTPDVDFSSDRIVVWRIDGILSFTLTGVVTDTDGPLAVTHEWYVNDVLQDGETADTIDLSFLDNGEHVVRLEAYDGDLTGEAEVTIVVYETSCEAAKGEDPDVPLQSDFNEDCVTNLVDFAEFVAEWLENTAL